MEDTISCLECGELRLKNVKNGKICNLCRRLFVCDNCFEKHKEENHLGETVTTISYEIPKFFFGMRIMFKKIVFSIFLMIVLCFVGYQTERDVWEMFEGGFFSMGYMISCVPFGWYAVKQVKVIVMNMTNLAFSLNEDINKRDGLIVMYIVFLPFMFGKYTLKFVLSMMVGMFVLPIEIIFTIVWSVLKKNGNKQ